MWNIPSGHFSRRVLACRSLLSLACYAAYFREHMMTTCFLKPSLRVLLLVSGSLLVTETALAQDFPSRPVTVIVPMSAGGQADILARALAEQMGKVLHQGIVVFNRDGAAGTVGVTAVKDAHPDGYTIGFGTQGPFTIQPQLRKVLRYQADDFEFICQTNTLPLIVAVGPKSPYGSLKDLLDAARKAPGSITLGSIGIGSGPHLLGEAIAKEAGVTVNHIPFRNISDLNMQLVSGGIDMTVTTPALLTSYKTIRALGVTGNQKLVSNPEVPLLKDLGYMRNALPGFMGIYAPKGTPQAALSSLRQACAAAVRAESYVSVSERMSSPAQHAESSSYSQSIRQDMNAMAELIQSVGIKPE